MPYSLKYQAEFTSINDLEYRLEIHELDYTGLFYNLELAANPVIQNWNSENPKETIKSSSLTINYLNDGSMPLERFLSHNDNQFLVKLFSGTTLLFVGYLVQDDFRELMVDYRHIVTLSANDGLGLLKEIELDANNIPSVLPCLVRSFPSNIVLPIGYFIQLTNVNFTPVVGTPFTISGHINAALNGTFTPVQVLRYSNTHYRVRVSNVMPLTQHYPCVVNGTSQIPNVNGKVSLLEIIKSCLNKTGLELLSVFYCDLFEYVNYTDRVVFEQTYIDKETFISGEGYNNCYNVLEKILSRFDVSIFQSNGEWNFIRWDQLRDTDNVNGFVYNSAFVFESNRNLDTNFVIGVDEETYPLFGIEKAVERPLEFTKETFNYNNPKYLLKNYDFLRVGALLRTYTSGADTIKEYVATDWEDYFGNTPVSNRFIRVTYDNLGNDKSREFVIRNTTFDTARSVQSKPIEVSKGDKVNFTFQFKTNVSQAGPLTVIFAVRLYNGSNNLYIDELPLDNGNWVSSLGFNYLITSGDNSNQYHSVSIKSSQMPNDGILYCYLSQATQTPQNISKETIYKDVRLEVINFINDSTKIIGHIHKDKQPVVIKNKLEEDISIDDSPRNTIAGTLFTALSSGILQIKTVEWFRNGVNEKRKLGDITTTEKLQYRQTNRLKIEGSFKGLKQGLSIINPLCWATYTLFYGYKFLIGSLEVNYRENEAKKTLWEIKNNVEPDFINEYSFTYIYDER